MSVLCAPQIAVKVGLRICAINGIDTTHMERKPCAALLNAPGPTIEVTFAPRDYYSYVVATKAVAPVAQPAPQSDTFAQKVADEPLYLQVGDVLPEQVYAPSITLGEDSVITMTSATKNCALYYTTDGSDPTQRDAKGYMLRSPYRFFYGSFTPMLNYDVAGVHTYRAFALCKGMSDSDVNTVSFEVHQTQPCAIEYVAPDPSRASPFEFVELKLTGQSAGCDLRFVTSTTGASDASPTMSYDDSSRPLISLNPGTITHVSATARAYNADLSVPDAPTRGGVVYTKSVSEVTRAAYEVDRCPPCTISPEIDMGRASVSFDCADPHAEIFYVIGERIGTGKETDLDLPAAREPDTTVAIPEGPNANEAAKQYVLYPRGKKLQVPMGKAGSVPVQAIARSTGRWSSELAFHVIRLEECDTVEISPTTYTELSTVANNHKIKLTCSGTKDVKIIYTTDGKEPEQGGVSTLTYEKDLQFRLFLGAAPKWVKARAIRKGFLNGPVMEHAFERDKQLGNSTAAGTGSSTLLGGGVFNPHKREPDASETGSHGVVTRKASSLMPILSKGSFMLVRPESAADDAGVPVDELIKTSETKYSTNDLAAMTAKRRAIEKESEANRVLHERRKKEEKAVNEARTIDSIFGESGAIFDVMFDELWAEADVNLDLWFEFLMKSRKRYKAHGDGPYINFIEPFGNLFQYSPRTRIAGKYKPLQGTKDPSWMPFEKTKSQVAAEKGRQKSEMDTLIRTLNAKLSDLHRQRAPLTSYQALVADAKIPVSRLAELSNGVEWLSGKKTRSATFAAAPKSHETWDPRFSILAKQTKHTGKHVSFPAMEGAKQLAETARLQSNSGHAEAMVSLLQPMGLAFEDTDEGIVVSVIQGGRADSSGQVVNGMKLTSVNGTSVVDYSRKDVLELLKNANSDDSEVITNTAPPSLVDVFNDANAGAGASDDAELDKMQFRTALSDERVKPLLAAANLSASDSDSLFDQMDKSKDGVIKMVEFIKLGKATFLKGLASTIPSRGDKAQQVTLGFATVAGDASVCLADLFALLHPDSKGAPVAEERDATAASATASATNPSQTDFSFGGGSWDKSAFGTGTGEVITKAAQEADSVLVDVFNDANAGAGASDDTELDKMQFHAALSDERLKPLLTATKLSASDSDWLFDQMDRSKDGVIKMIEFVKLGKANFLASLASAIPPPGERAQQVKTHDHRSSRLESAAGDEVLVTLTRPMGIELEPMVDAKNAVVVKMLQPGENADRSGKVLVGMKLVAIDGESVAGKSVKEVTSELASIEDYGRLTFEHGQAAPNGGVVVSVAQPMGIGLEISAQGAIVVDRLVEGGNAEKARKILTGMELVSIDGKSVVGLATTKDVADEITAKEGPRQLRFAPIVTELVQGGTGPDDVFDQLGLSDGEALKKKSMFEGGGANNAVGFAASKVRPTIDFQVENRRSGFLDGSASNAETRRSTVEVESVNIEAVRGKMEKSLSKIMKEVHVKPATRPDKELETLRPKKRPEMPADRPRDSGLFAEEMKRAAKRRAQLDEDRKRALEEEEKKAGERFERKIRQHEDDDIKKPAKTGNAHRDELAGAVFNFQQKGSVRKPAKNEVRVLLDQPIGLSMKNSIEGVVVSRVVEGGNAARSGKIFPGMLVLRIDGVDLLGKMKTDLIAELKKKQNARFFDFRSAAEDASAEPVPKPGPAEEPMDIKGTDEEVAAATKIQAGFRGHQTRKSMAGGDGDGAVKPEAEEAKPEPVTDFTFGGGSWDKSAFGTGTGEVITKAAQEADSVLVDVFNDANAGAGASDDAELDKMQFRTALSDERVKPLLAAANLSASDSDWLFDQMDKSKDGVIKMIEFVKLGNGGYLANAVSQRNEQNEGATKAEEERLAAEAVAKAEEERIAAEAVAKAEEERIAAEAVATKGKYDADEQVEDDYASPQARRRLPWAHQSRRTTFTG